MVVSWVSATVTCQSAFCQPADYNPVLTGILWVLIMWSNSSLICLYFSSVCGVRMSADSSSGLSPPLFSFLLNACQVPQPQRRMEGRHTNEGTERWTVGTDDDDRDEATESMWGEGERGKKRWEEGSGFNKKYLHTVSVCWSSDQCPRLFSCTCPQTRGCGQPSHLRRDLGCHSRLGPSFSMSANRAVAQHSWRALGVGKRNPGEQLRRDIMVMKCEEVHFRM